MLDNKSLVSSANYLTDLNSTYSKAIVLYKNNVLIPTGINHTIEATISYFDRTEFIDKELILKAPVVIDSNTSMLVELANIVSEISTQIDDSIVLNSSAINGTDLLINISVSTDSTILRTLNIKVKYGSVLKYDLYSTSNEYIQILTNAGLFDLNIINAISDIGTQILPNLDEILLVDDRANEVSINTDLVSTMKSEVTSMRDETNANRDSSILSATSALASKNETQELYDLTVVAKNSAQSSASNALISEQNADISETNAKASELIAIQKASEASTSALSASSSASLATAKATEASASALSASVSANNALNSANSSSSSASSSASSANSASTSASSASASATTATTKANEATSSAANALSSANTATTKATEASNSADIATTKASESSSSASSALTSANSVIASASVATTKASEALQSASNASTSAINAESSNQSAISARDTILAIELQAEGFAANALASKNLAEKWASEAEDVVVASGKYSAYHYMLKAEEFASLSLSVIDDTESGTNTTYSSNKIENDLDVIGFDLAANITVGPGQIAWNATEGTYDMGLENGSVLQVGQETLVKVRAGTAITNGRVVMATGSIGSSGRIIVGLHDGTKANARRVLGIATQDIANGADGFVTVFGKVRNINTTGSSVGETWVDGDILYIKPNDNGSLTKIQPLDTEIAMPVAFVMHTHSNGTLFVRVTGIDENHDKNLIAAKADAATTLNGYGITDAYTKTEIDTITGDINSALDTINGEVI